MADPDLQNAFSSMSILLLKIAVIVLLCTFVMWGIYRILYCFLIEKGYREKIIYKIDNSIFIKKLVHIFAPESNFLKEPEELEENSLKNNNLKISFKDEGVQLLVKYLEEEMIFNKGVALVLLFFYKNSSGKKTFNDFNAWLRNINKTSFETDYRLFRQTIKDINGRFYKDSNYIFSLIEQVKNDEKNSTKANFYRYRIKLKK